MLGQLITGRSRLLLLAMISTAMVAVTVACGSDDATATPTDGPGADPTSTSTPGASLSGNILIDGSSTVFPITEAVAEEFRKDNSNVDVTVGVSGTGGGFRRFTSGETDISDASRPIKDSEAEDAVANGVEYYELPVAFDGLSVVVNAENDWVDCLTVAELQMIWEPGSTLSNWNEIRSEFPDRSIRLYGPGTDSGTFDYFTEAINGSGGASRPDYTASEDDNVLVQGIAGDEGSLGYFGYAYYAENTDKLKVLGVDGGSGCITPSEQTINDGTYAPLSRPLFIYVNVDKLETPRLKAFVEFYLENAAELASEVGYVALPQSMYDDGLTLVRTGVAAQATPTPSPTAIPSLSGNILIDGSSTVFPITEAVAEEFRRDQSGVNITVGVSGTGGGFRRFTTGETDISDASRPIKESEAEDAASAGVEYYELPVAFDGLSVVVNADNDWVDCLTVAELQMIWEPGSTVSNWNEIRSEFPDRSIRLYGPGTDSGTFDYFTEAINGEGGASRPDYTASEDDNVLVQGIAGDEGSLGYFGYAYYAENTDKLKVLGVDGGSGCITPSAETINNGTYAPLSRPLFIYVNVAKLEDAHKLAFVLFYMENAAELAAEVGYVALPQSMYDDNLALINGE